MEQLKLQLSPEHRALARKLWDGLYNAPSNDHLIEARYAFDGAPPEVRDAILRASVDTWQGEAEGFNPFDITSSS